MQNATETMMHIDVRRRRAEVLVHESFRRIEPFLREDARRDALDVLFDLFCQEGVEVITDRDREAHGLPPRGPAGWTSHELNALEQRRLQAMFGPVLQTVVKG